MVMFAVRADWHTLFDANTWMLIPTRDTLEELMKHSGTMRFSGENRVDINSVRIFIFRFLTKAS